MSRVKAFASKRLSLSMTLWLLVLWTLLFASFDPLVLLSGLLVALFIQLIFPLPRSRFFANFRLRQGLILAGVFLVDMVKAAVHVASVVVTGRDYECGVVRIDLRSSADITMAVTAAMINLVPGTIVVELKRREGVIYLHVFDLEAQGGVEGVRAASLAQEERVLKALASAQTLETVGVKL